MWIETDTYIGPCRRQGGKGRLLNRRKASLAARDPSLVALVRQLRAASLDLTCPEKRRHFQLLLAATIGVARRTQANAAAVRLEQLQRTLSDRQLAAPGASSLIEPQLQAILGLVPQR